jgi:hypothetical protein
VGHVLHVAVFTMQVGAKWTVSLSENFVVHSVKVTLFNCCDLYLKHPGRRVQPLVWQ